MKQEVMKHFLKGAASVAIVLLFSMLIHIFFNMKGLDLNNYVGNYMEIMLLSSIAILIYRALIKNENNEENR